MLFLMFPTCVIRSELIFLHLLPSQRNFLARDSGSTFAIAHKHFERKEDIVLPMMPKTFWGAKSGTTWIQKEPSPSNFTGEESEAQT